MVSLLAEIETFSFWPKTMDYNYMIILRYRGNYQAESTPGAHTYVSIMLPYDSRTYPCELVRDTESDYC